MSYKIRETKGANIYYPKDNDKLKKIINDSLKTDVEKVDKNPFGLISSYGHYLTASQMYGATYKQLIKRKYDTVVIIGPVHKTAFPGIALAEYDSFNTPLGDLNVDKEANTLLKNFNKEFIIYKNKYHDAEYCIENQLPYIISVLGENTKIVPILLGEFNTKFTIMIADALKKLFEKQDKKFLVISVTNLSRDVKYEEAVQTDNKFADYLINFNPDRLSEQLAMGEITAKGGGCVVALQRLGKLFNYDRMRVLRLANSGDFGDEKDKVEGYISAVIW